MNLDLKTLYLEQVKKSILNIVNQDVSDRITNPGSLDDFYEPGWKQHVLDSRTKTMCGKDKIENVQFCIEDCLARNVPGDLIECGVWRGGVTILMRAILAAHGIGDRTVWVADSFEGFPELAADSVDRKTYRFERGKFAKIAVDQGTVRRNFERYGLLDDQVRFLQGWFKDTLPTAPIERLAVLRMDGDLYQSTMDILEHLYPKLSPGGYVILDEWGNDKLWGEQQAAVEYRARHGITEKIVRVDWECAYWRKNDSSKCE